MVCWSSRSPVVTAAGDFHRAWQALPLGTLNDIIGDGTCLVLAPHPDDESLGCGGLIAMAVAARRPPLIAVLTDGAGSHPNSRIYPPERLRALRSLEVREAVRHLGLPSDRVISLGQPDTAAPHAGADFDAVVSRLTGIIRDDPAITTILAPWRHDPHCDHEAASLIAAGVVGMTGIRHVAYPVWGWTLPAEADVPGSPTIGWRLDISRFQLVKRLAVQAHKSQYGDLITDDPTGFCLPDGLLSVFDNAHETFIQP